MKRMKIEGMHCNGCARSVSNALSAVNGIEDVHVDLATSTASFSSNEVGVETEAVNAVTELGYTVTELV